MTVLLSQSTVILHCDINRPFFPPPSFFLPNVHSPLNFIYQPYFSISPPFTLDTLSLSSHAPFGLPILCPLSSLPIRHLPRPSHLPSGIAFHVEAANGRRMVEGV